MSKRRRQNTSNTRARETQLRTQTVTTTARSTVSSRPPRASRMDAAQGMIMPAFVSLGCWGLAISFIFFFPDPNHLLYGGMAAAMGLIWSIIVGLRIKRVVQMSREGRIYR